MAVMELFATVERKISAAIFIANCLRMRINIKEITHTTNSMKEEYGYFYGKDQAYRK